jgi:hypothetical protein
MIFETGREAHEAFKLQASALIQAVLNRVMEDVDDVISLPGLNATKWIRTVSVQIFVLEQAGGLRKLDMRRLAQYPL